MIKIIKSTKFLIALLIVLFCYSILVDVFKISLNADKLLSDMLNMIITRVLGGIVFLLLIIRYDYNIFKFKNNNFLKAVLISLPCLLICINNLPLIAIITKNAYLIRSSRDLMIFIVQCFSIGLFEEMAFRGIVLLLIVNKFAKTTKGIFISLILSSAIFGGIHLFNIFSGAGIGDTILQVGYSFLMGGMWGAILLKTHNIWLCVMLHAVYDFCGMLMPTLGAGTWWDLPTIIITVIFSIAIFIYIIYLIFTINIKDINYIYKKDN